MDIIHTQSRRQFLKGICFLLPGLNLYSCGKRSPEKAAVPPQGTIIPTITIEPADTAVRIGHPASFQVTTEGTQPLSFQWYRNSQIILGATEPTYTLIATSKLDTGNKFSVRITNQTGSVDSRLALLTITLGTTIDTTAIRIDTTRKTIDEV